MQSGAGCRPARRTDSVCLDISLAHSRTQVVNQVGSWGNFVSTMELTRRLGSGSGLLVSGVVIVRVLPSLFWFPAAGVVADRCGDPVMSTN